MKRSYLVVSALVGGLGLLIASSFAAGGGPAKPPASSAWAGPERCADCHPNTYDAWKESTHANTLRVASAKTLPRVMVKGGTVLHLPGKSTFFHSGKKFFVRTTGADGKQHRYPVKYIVGRRRVSMFLTRMPDGRLQVLPTMLDRPYGSFFDYSHLMFGGPGVDPMTPPVIHPGEPSFWTGPTRLFDATCARCHTEGWKFTGVRKDGKPWSTWRRPGVTCEDCHGPGASHSAYESDNPPAGLNRDPLVKLSKLSRSKAQSVCLSCHTEAKEIVPGFRPGDDYLDYYDPTLLDSSDVVDPTARPLELIYDGLPFSSSRCVQKGGLTCLTCHDPHESPYRSQLKVPPGSDAICIRCHQDVAKEGRAHTHHDPSRPGSSCTSCHMPFITVERGHGVVTDHTIGIPSPGAFKSHVAEDACDWCHSGHREAPGAVPRIGRKDVVAAYRKWWPNAKPEPEWAKAFDDARTGGANAFSELLGVARDGSVPEMIRASAVKLLGAYGAQAKAPLMKFAESDDSLIRRCAADALGSVPGDAATSELLSLLMDSSPAVRWHAATAAMRGFTRAKQNPSLLDATIEELVAETTRLPQYDERWFLLGAAYQLANEPKKAMGAYGKKLELDPYARLVRKEYDKLRDEVRGK